MSAGRICTRVVATAGSEETVSAAAARMKEHNLGTLVVLDENGKPSGILTDRDIVIRCIAEGSDPKVIVVGDVMTAPVRSVTESAPIEDALAMMESTGARRLVVTDSEGRLAGLLAVDDVIQLLAEEMGRIDGILEREAPII